MAMNEKELKNLFCSSVLSGHIRKNDLIPPSKEAELKIVQEAEFRRFDLLIAAVMRGNSAGSNSEAASRSCCESLLLRTSQLTNFARREKCTPQETRFFPIELKSDEDSLDARLPNQIIDAILTFGLSIVVLDDSHSKKAKLDR